MKKKEIEQLKKLIYKYYLEKRDDASCQAVFAIKMTWKAIETDCQFQEYMEIDHEDSNQD